MQYDNTDAPFDNAKALLGGKEGFEERHAVEDQMTERLAQTERRLMEMESSQFTEPRASFQKLLASTLRELEAEENKFLRTQNRNFTRSICQQTHLFVSCEIRMYNLTRSFLSQKNSTVPIYRRIVLNTNVSNVSSVVVDSLASSSLRSLPRYPQQDIGEWIC
jgi:hypothetical protein